MDAKARFGLMLATMGGDERKGNPEYLYNPRKGDIIAIGPMKCGTTWLQQILHQIRTKGDDKFDDIYGITWYIPHPDGNGMSLKLNEEQVCNPRVFKCHEAYGCIKISEEVKHIVIVRNPYDSAYSFIKFASRWFGGEEDATDEECAELYRTSHDANGTTMPSSAKCIASWFEHRNDNNVLYLFYEDLLKDLEAVIKKIAEFVEIPLTNEELKRVAYFSSFEYMKNNKQKFQNESTIDYMSLLTNIEKWTPKMSMIREDGGKAGQGMKNIGPKLKAVIDKQWIEQIEDVYGYKSYDDMYCENSLFKR